MSFRLRRATRGQLRAGVGRLVEGPRSDGRICMVIDADRTLAPQDTGRLVGKAVGMDGTIRGIFETYGYAEEAFSRVAEAWATLSEDRYRAKLSAIAEAISIREAWQTILAEAGDRVPVVVVTAGIPQVWEIVLARHGRGGLPVVGGCHADLDEYVVCPETKADLVAILQEAGWEVVAAGDSRIDLPMLQRADVPLFVADDKGSPALRERLHLVPGVRHLVVDDQRFEGLPACTTDDVVRLIRTGEWDYAY